MVEAAMAEAVRGRGTMAVVTMVAAEKVGSAEAAHAVEVRQAA